MTLQCSWLIISLSSDWLWWKHDTWVDTLIFYTSYTWKEINKDEDNNYTFLTFIYLFFKARHLGHVQTETKTKTNRGRYQKGIPSTRNRHQKCVRPHETAQPAGDAVVILANPPDFRGRLPISLPSPGFLPGSYFSRFLTKSDLLRRTVSTRTLIQLHHCLVSMVA